MPWEVQHPTPWQQALAIAGAARAAGVSFETFWQGAVRPGRPPITWRVPPGKRPAGAIVWPTDSQARKDDQAAMAATRDGWERAYVGVEQSAQERALPVLSSLFDRAAALRAGEEERELGGGVPAGDALLSAA